MSELNFNIHITFYLRQHHVPYYSLQMSRETLLVGTIQKDYCTMVFTFGKRYLPQIVNNVLCLSKVDLI